MSITARQKQLVQESFARVEPIAEQAAEIFYQTLFEFDPSLRHLFKNDIKSQGKKLMMTLKVAVKGLDNLEGLVPVLHQLAERHVDYGVKAEHFTPVGNALLYTLKVGLGEHWNPEVRKAWVDTFRLVATVMKQHSFS
jgi:hemoglobin-like flavoprotein